MRRRELAGLVAAVAACATVLPRRARATGIRPAVFSGGQSQAGAGGTAPPRTGPADTDTTARFPTRLFMFQTSAGVSGSIIEGVRRAGPNQPRPANRFEPSKYLGTTAYRDDAGATINAATPFLFALTSRLEARGLIPNGMFGFTAWEGAAPLNAFLAPGDPDYAIGPDGNRTNPLPVNYENLVAAIARYAALTVAAGFTPFVPLIRFEHGEGRIYPRGERDLAAEKTRYVAAHLRMTDGLAAAVRGITGQNVDPIFLLGGWGGNDTSTGLNDVSHDAVRRLVLARPARYVGPASSVYMGPLYQDGGPASEVHPGFVGRVVVGEAQARAANLCLGAGLVPNAAGYAPLRCIGITRAAVGVPAFDLIYQRPSGAVGGLALVVDDLLPATPNHGFEYQGADRSRTQVVDAVVVAEDRVRVFLNRPPTDPAGEIVYGFLPRDSAFQDGLWNYRGNLVWPNDAAFFYGPILAAPPYERALPATQRDVAVPQRVLLPEDSPGPVIDPR